MEISLWVFFPTATKKSEQSANKVTVVHQKAVRGEKLGRKDWSYMLIISCVFPSSFEKGPSGTQNIGNMTPSAG